MNDWKQVEADHLREMQKAGTNPPEKPKQDRCWECTNFLGQEFHVLKIANGFYRNICPECRAKRPKNTRGSRITGRSFSDQQLEFIHATLVSLSRCKDQNGNYNHDAMIYIADLVYIAEIAGGAR